MTTTFHFWADFETTGLVPDMDTVLEAAWTITNDQLQMLTPLRSRLCVIDPPARRSKAANRQAKHPLGNLTSFSVGSLSVHDRGDWGLLSQVVQDMHEMSGLRDALVGAVNHPAESLRVLRTANDLGRLIQEDLAAVDYDRTRDRLILSGAGVSHFDNRVFACHLPQLFPLGGESPTGYAYWQHDVSVAARVLGDTWTALRTDAAKLDGDHPIYLNECQGFSFDPSALVGHRAADDVIQALIDGRILRAATGWSVK